jgi:crotonobetaine/carnitine-CoA ligase
MKAVPLLDAHCNPFAGWDVRSLLELQAKRLGDRSCLIWEPIEGATGRWSYDAFVREIARTGAGLAARGIGAGDRVIVHLENCPEHLFTWLGCAWIGAVAVTTNPRSSRDELAWFADISRSRAAITHPKFRDLVESAFPQAEWIALTDTDAGDTPVRKTVAAEAFSALARDAASAPPGRADCAAPFSVQFTSGTTSRPKGVVWTHANALWGARVSAAHEDLRPDDVHLVHLPLCHTNAQVYSVMASLWVGATIVLQPRFSASRFWPVALKHRCTWSSMVPFAVQALLQQAVPEAHRFRFWGNGLCDMPTDAHFRVRTLGWWGMTETVTHGIVGSAHHPDLPMSMGRAAPEYSIVVRGEDGSPARPGETGDLLVRGVRGLSLFHEYLEDPSATAASFTPDGWMITGDRVTLADDGWLVFADRAKDMLKVGGENVAASEVERVIASLPGVLEVAVVGKPDPMLQEVPVAFVRLQAQADAQPEAFVASVLEACRTQLASFKLPREVHLLDDFPRATLNKIAKAELRKRLTAGQER